MIVVWGSRFYGKVDKVPGLFHVATRFGHVYYLPIIPMRSYVILGDDAGRGVKIPLSARSIFIAWGCAVSLVIGAIAMIMTLVSLNSWHPDGWIVPATIGAVFWSGFALLAWHPGIRRAKFNRACVLAGVLQLSDASMAKFERHFGQAAARGFDVSPAMRAVRVGEPISPAAQL